MRVLIAEDEKNLNRILAKQLTENGYVVDACLDGQEALEFIELSDHDIIILDINLPKADGWDILKKIRESGKDVPVLFLTARDSIADRVKGLDAGADDYLTKPFAFEELLARIRVLVRRETGNTTNVYSIANLKVDTLSKEVWRDNLPIALSSKEFAILEYMMLNQNIVLSRDRLEHHIWGYEYQGDSNMIDVYIRYLRKKIDDNFEPKLIHTIRGSGYVLKERL